MMSNEECGLIATAIRHGPYPPRPEYLPACHRLAERGWLVRRFIRGELTFGLSATGVAALELGVPLSEAHEAMN